MSCQRESLLTIVAGDDYTIIIPLSAEDREAVLSDGDVVKAIITQGDTTIEVVGSSEDDEVTFVLSCDQTALLSGRSAWFCTHIYWRDGGRSTVKFNEAYGFNINVVRCHND